MRVQEITLVVNQMFCSLIWLSWEHQSSFGSNAIPRDEQLENASAAELFSLYYAICQFLGKLDVGSPHITSISTVVQSAVYFCAE